MWKSTRKEEAEAATTLDDMWRCVGGWIDARYDAAFAGAPLDRAVEAPDASASWESPISSAAGFQQQAATIGARLEHLGGMLGDTGNNGATLSLAMASTGRYLSETANVSLTRYAQGWVVTAEYSTAWEPNYEDLDTFLLGLPPAPTAWGSSTRTRAIGTRRPVRGPAYAMATRDSPQVVSLPTRPSLRTT